MYEKPLCYTIIEIAERMKDINKQLMNTFE